jgi:hypothetical protein
MAQACSDERRKLEVELASYARDRGILAKMCPMLMN